MKEQPTRFTSIDLNDATFKVKLYLLKLNDETLPNSTLQKVCHLTVENLTRFIQSQEFVKENYERIKSIVLDKKSYYALYIVDCFLKNSKSVISIAKRDLEPMFKAVWQKIYSQSKKDVKLENLKCMVKTWGVIYAKKSNIEESLKKWLLEKYSTDLTLSQKYKILFQESYENLKSNLNSSSTSNTKFQALISEMRKQEPTKSMQSEFDPRLFED